MKNLKLKQLRVNNFKGIKKLEIDFDNQITNIRGVNRSGKTTTFDAWNWLLFDKDSSGSSQFSIKPLDEGNQVIKGLKPTVEATIEVNGTDNFLKKEYSEKWTKPRGSEEEVFSGNVTKYWWNDAPISKGEYQTKINEVIPEDTFKILTNPLEFNTLHWEKRREVLISIAGDVSDMEVVKANKLNIVEAILNEGKDLIESKKAYAAKKKRHKDELKDIPSRIDEVLQSKIEDKDYKEIEKQIQITENSIKDYDSQIEDLAEKNNAKNKELLISQNKLNEFKLELQRIEAEIKSSEFESKSKLNSEMNELDLLISKTKNSISSKENSIKEYKSSIERLEKKNEELRELFADVYSREFKLKEGDASCNSCGQDLPNSESKISELKLDFNKRKNAKIKEINEQGKSNKAEIDKFVGLIKVHEADIENLNKTITDSATKKQDLELKLQQTNFEPSKELIDKRDSKKEEIENFTLPCVELESNESLKEEKSKLQTSLDELKKDFNTKDINDKADKRIAELTDQRKKLSELIAKLEQAEMEIETFVKSKMDIVENRVNKLFANCSFKMFEEQVNGGQNPICDCLVNGVPFKDVNTAGKINAGIDIINALQSYYDVKAPIFIDNRESVTQIIESDSQIVNLIVDRECTELVVS